MCWVRLLNPRAEPREILARLRALATLSRTPGPLQPRPTPRTPPIRRDSRARVTAHQPAQP